MTTPPTEPTDGEQQQGGTSPFSFEKPADQQQPQQPSYGQQPSSGQQPSYGSGTTYGQPEQQSPYGQQPSAQPDQQAYGQQAYGQQAYDEQQGYGQQQGYATQSYGSGYATQGYGGYATGSPAPSSGLAVGALVAGIVSILTFLCGFLAIPAGIAAVVLGFVALNKVKAGTGGGRGLAIAGLACGAVGGVLSLIVTIAAIATGNADFSTSP